MTSQLRGLLANAIASKSRTSEVALLLSGGLDSLTVGIACQDLGKRVVAYTYELEGYASADRPKAEFLAGHFDWPLHTIKIPTSNLTDTFRRQAIVLRYKKKVHHEVIYPISLMIPHIEQDEILTGWNADDHYGNTAKVQITFAKLRREGYSETELKTAFDNLRRKVYEDFDSPDSSDTFWLTRGLVTSARKLLIDPYIDHSIRDYFSHFHHHELCDPKKPVIRAAFSEALKAIPDRMIASGIKLQKGGQVDKLFETLLDDDVINRFERRYTTVSSLCQRWAREVSSNPAIYQAEIDTLPAPPVATVTPPAGASDVRSLQMKDVLLSSARNLFSVVSLFAGGGGSSTGYRLAGGTVRAINEFIPEAARTYARNFPDTVIDQRDIRELIRELRS